MSNSDFQALWEEMETIGDYYTRNTCLETLRRYDDALKQIEQLKADLQEANDNAEWWHNRYKALQNGGDSQ